MVLARHFSPEFVTVANNSNGRVQGRGSLGLENDSGNFLAFLIFFFTGKLFARLFLVVKN